MLQKIHLKKRVLFVMQEFSPYLAITEFSEFINKLSVAVNAADFEVRCIMPRFGCINDRRYRLHEVLRLTGINITIDNKNYDLHIKVASLPHSRLQIYFLDNVEMFAREGIFYNEEDESWFEDNGLRSFFFCRGAVETVKKFGWPPDIIHCSGWFSAFLPFLIRKTFKKDPIFSNTKIVNSIYENGFPGKLENALPDKIKASLNLKENQMPPLRILTHTSLMALMTTHGNFSFVHDEMNLDKKLRVLLNEEASKGKKILYANPPWNVNKIIELFRKLK